MTERPPTVYRRRCCSPEEATKLVGDSAVEREPNIGLPCIVHDAETRLPILAYVQLRDPGSLRRAVLKIDYGAGLGRQKNYRSRSRTFGYSPRRPVVLRESCNMSALGWENPEVEKVVEGYADQFSDWLDVINPNIRVADTAQLASVLPEWCIGEAKLWTSGVINDTAVLPYHRDGFNFPTWSAMPVVRRGIRGGHLHVPEYDLVVPCGDGSVTLFEGYKYVHGVTPIRRMKKNDGYRVSVVYYALRGMKDCRTAAEEVAYGQQRRTERESEMMERLKRGDRTIPGNKARV